MRGATAGRWIAGVVATVAAVLVPVVPSSALPPGTAADYSGDGKADIALFRPSTGGWHVRGMATVVHGTSGDIPVPGDYDGNGVTDLAVFRPSTATWHIKGQPTVAFGAGTDVPVPGDYNNDAKTDVAVFRRSTATWHVNGLPTVTFGTGTDIPVPGDYDGNGSTEIAVFRPSTSTWHFHTGAATITFGAAADIPVPGDYNDDGKTDVAVFRPSTGTWHQRNIANVVLGGANDRPQPGDYDGDGKTDPAVFRPSTGTWLVAGQPNVSFGASTDIGLPETAAIRLSTPNTAPTITNITNKSTNEETATSPIPFTIGDTWTPPGSLTLVKNSSNTTLVPLANIVFGGSGANRTITITPAANQTGSVTITVTVSDGALTATDTFGLFVDNVNDAPTVTLGGATVVVGEGGAAKTLAPGAVVADGDSSNLEAGTVRISEGFRAGDNLLFIDTVNVVGSYNTGNGILTLSGTAPPGEYQEALRSIQFQVFGDDPGTSRTIEFKLSDGMDLSPPVTRTVTITPVDDAPTLSSTIENAAVSEESGLGTLLADVVIDDPDSATIDAATVRIANGRQPGDQLLFTPQEGITTVYDKATATLRLTGTAPKVIYQTALRQVRLQADDNPNMGKTVVFRVNSNGRDSLPHSINLGVTAANDIPVVGLDAGTLTHRPGDTDFRVAPNAAILDPDDTVMMSGRVAIGPGFVAGDELVLIDGNGTSVSAVYDAVLGQMTFTGAAFIQDYETLFQRVALRPAANSPGARSIVFFVNDGDVSSISRSRTVTVSASTA